MTSTEGKGMVKGRVVVDLCAILCKVTELLSGTKSSMFSADKLAH